MINLHGKKMNVIETSKDGVVNENAIFYFSQKENRVLAKYAGGGVERGYLIGSLDGDDFYFRYGQKDNTGHLDFGRSHAVLTEQDGKVGLIEYFEWKTRPGVKGKNVFMECN